MSDPYLDDLLAIPEDEIARWKQADRDWYHAQVSRRLALRSPADFAVAHSNGRWEPYSHLVFTSDAIVDMVENDSCDVLVVDQCVRHGKTELCSRWTPTWFETKYPTQRTLLSSYEADFAATHGRVVRDYINEFGPGYGIAVSNESKAAARWDLTNGVGGMGTAGAGGPIIGKGGHLLIVDDPVKNFEEANSQVYRDKLWDWWQNVWLGRREPGAKCIVIMSRWHQDDLVGRLLTHDTGMRLKHLRMPAIAEEDDILGRQPGQALCPQRYDEEALAATKKAVGPVAWSSQYQQRPQARGGGILKPDKLVRYSRVELAGDRYYEAGDRRVSMDECSRFCTFDPAYTRTKRSDFTVLGTWAVGPDQDGVPQLICLNIDRRRAAAAEHTMMVESTWRDWSPAWIGIEKQTATMSLFSEMQRNGVVVRWLNPDKNKVARAETARGLLETDRIWVPADATWLVEFCDELAIFPVGKHDDQVDVLTYAAQEVVERHVHPRRARQKVKSYEDEIWEKVKKMRTPARTHPTLGRWP